MRHLLVLLVLATMIGCKGNTNQSTKATSSITPITDKVLESASIYEVNIRQYSAKGTFNSFSKDIPKLKKMGVKILWLMPIYPISKVDRKGSLGSYYAIQNYTKVNPNFGTMDDLKKLVKTAHQNGLYVILDWVANHTGRDHHWLKDHPNFYVRDKNGKPVAPFNWTDVAKLNYKNPNLRKAMISKMQFWLKNADIDGFRCDVASEVPNDFWKMAIQQLRKTKPIFMLAEAEKPSLFNNGFDMQYGWNAYHIMNGIAQGKKNVMAFDNYMVKTDSLLPKKDILMDFTTNHDENSWNGTVFERLGNAAKTMAVLTYMVPGMPLIYDGQEYGLNKRLKFFEKDTIIQKKSKFFKLYKQLNTLKATHKALNGGENPASYTRLSTSNNTSILAFSREKERDKIIFIANLTDKPVTFSANLQGDYKDAITLKKETFAKDSTYTFKPWEYKILTK